LTRQKRARQVKAIGTTDDGGNGRLHHSFGALLVGRRSDAADTVARGACHASLASHTDLSDRHITFVSRSMVGGLEIDLVLRLRRLRSAAGLVAGRKRHPQAEDTFLTPRAWHVGLAIVLTNLTYTRARGSWWLIEARWRALILRTIGDR